jgi:L-fuconolactonase
LKRDEDGAWLNSQEGQEMLDVAEDLSLLVSLSCYPHQQLEIRKAAARHPSVNFLCHHLGFPAFGKETLAANIEQILASASLENIYLKVSGFAYAAARNWDFPYQDVQWILQKEYEAFGPYRLCWGSDYPVVRAYMTYRQSLEALRSHCAFIPSGEMEWILGGNMKKLL